MAQHKTGPLAKPEVDQAARLKPSRYGESMRLIGVKLKQGSYGGGVSSPESGFTTV
jgi:hypothetical protein